MNLLMIVPRSARMIQLHILRDITDITDMADNNKQVKRGINEENIGRYRTI